MPAIAQSSLLSVSPETFFSNALANHQAGISNAGNLAVGTGKTLTLFGSTVTSTGSLTAPSGTVQVLGDRILNKRLSHMHILHILSIK